LTSLSRRSKAKFKSPRNFEETPYVAARVFSPLVIYENVDIVHVFIVQGDFFALQREPWSVVFSGYFGFLHQ
jgi:hypothetical protein